MKNQQTTKAPLNELALFAGAGGGILGGILSGWKTICAVELDEYSRRVLLQRQNDGILPPFPIWDNVETFNGRPWRGRVDVVSGGFPCQDISCAGRGDGIEGSRSGLWGEMARIIGEVRPRFVFVENSPLLISRGLEVCLGDLAAMGFDAEWCIVSAENVGAPHKRDRIWILADNPNNRRRSRRQGGSDSSCKGESKQTFCDAPDADAIRRNGGAGPVEKENRGRQSKNPGRWPVEPEVGRVAHGVAYRVDRLRALGNGQVPRVAATAWDILKND